MGSQIGRLGYEGLLEAAQGYSLEAVAVLLLDELPYLWRDAYLLMTARPTNIVRLRHNSFDYFFDDFATLEEKGEVARDATTDSRLVAVIGRSEPRAGRQDDSRLKGWLGATEKRFGRKWDKGHFIANSIGGAVDRLELNVFAQRRDLNRGWSAAGRRYREMEKYCCANAGTLCFSRPIYHDETATPAFIEFGVLKNTGELWTECFDNR